VDLTQQLFALAQIIVIDFTLAGDNAIVVGLAASRVDPRIRAKVILIGIVGAVVLRIMFAAVATQLLTIVGLTLAGGILLLWVCWKMYREISFPHPQPAFAGAAGAGGNSPEMYTMSFGAAITQIVIADVSMSLDNVLAVAGAAREHPTVLIIGLAMSIALMGFAATFIARLLHRHRWIAYVGLLIILYVSLKMMYDGAVGVWPEYSFTALTGGL